ncbi:MAG TPA: exopolysaccharide transport family protein [Methyloceanibacter sp.]|nr:exopolysaccharide transport family protein [Methyloceanibacter sp.]
MTVHAQEFSGLTPPDAVRPVAEDIDLQTLGRALWRAKGWIVSLALGAGVITFIVLSTMRPLYTSEARILLQNDESVFTRPAGEPSRDGARTVDEQAVQSQVQVLTSRDLAVQVIDDLNLIGNPAFEKDAGGTLLSRLLKRIGLGGRSPHSEEERAANAFAEHLSVFQLSKSSVIAVNYTSGDPNLAAAVANKLADIYIDWQREAKLAQTKDATAWLSSQIEVLRPKVAEAEAAVEQFRASQGLYAGSNNVTLNAQQLSELNSQLILAKAQRSEAEARARLIKKMLEEKSDIDATPEVLKSELIARLIDQRVQVQRQLAELSATLLPSHPRIKQLNSELADVRAQIRAEAIKIVQSLENEAEIAAAREASLRASLNEVKTQASGLSEAEIKLRALEREAKAQRDLLESYLARYRDASARHDMGAVPAQATIVSRAHASILPSFPKKGPMSLLAAAAVALLSLAYVLARELIAAPAVARAAPAESRHDKRRRRAEPDDTRGLPETSASVAVQMQSPLTQAPLMPTGQAELPLTVPAAADTAAATAPAAQEGRSLFRRRAGDRAKTATARNAETASQDAAPAAHTPTSLLERLRQTATAHVNSPQDAAPFDGWLARIRRARRPRTKSASNKRKGETMPPLRTNDLRHYLSQRLALAAAEAATESKPKQKAAATANDEKIGPVLKSLDALLNNIIAAGRGGAPRAVLVAGGAAKVDSSREAIAIARALVDRRERVVLLDLTRSAGAVSGPLELARAPGLTELLAERASFEDVIQIDPATELQVIPAGDPKLAAKKDENEIFTPIFEALLQTYDCVVLHGDIDAVRRLTPALKFEIPVVVAVLRPGVSPDDIKSDLSIYSMLGCPVLLYEQSGKPRTGLLGRVAAI